MSQILPPKKEVALALLERSSVHVHLDPRAAGVVVPPQFRKEPRLKLTIGLNLPIPIPDLRLDDESMTCTLSFSRTRFFCVVPWPSVFAIVGDDGRGMVWPDDVPGELQEKMMEERREPAPSPSPSSSSSASAGSPSSPRAAPGERRAPRLTDASAPSAATAARAPKAKRGNANANVTGNASGNGKKKRGDARPTLVAVPPAAPSESARDGATPPAAPSSAGAPASPPPRPAGVPSRPKRELPPYLRVVK